MRGRKALATLIAVAALAPTLVLAHSVAPEDEPTLNQSFADLSETLYRFNEDPKINKPVAKGFKLVGHDPLFSRGMNAALAVHDDYVYVGSRTDGSPQHRNPGILVVDVSNPRRPETVHEIGPPDAALVGETSRELRVWPQKNLLVVMNFGCSSAIHACTAGETQGNRFTFFDISGENAAAPKHVATYEPSRTPHEMYLWVDPEQPRKRALLFNTTPTSSQTRPNLIVTDISKARKGKFREYPWVAEFPAGTFDNGEDEDRRLHSLGVSNDGRRSYLAFLGAGFLMLDTSEVAEGVPDPEIRLVTPPENRANWSNPGAHSAVKLFGRDLALVTDEVYGDALDALGPHGCPWGWVRMLDMSDAREPQVVGDYRVRQNRPSYCDTAEGSDPTNTTFTSYSAHNPTLTDRLAFITWHSAGLHALKLRREPKRTGVFSPRPLDAVVTEDPALSLGQSKVVMWSYPVIKNGLIYVIDIRNGLYILRYTGAGANEVSDIGFLEGNSHLGAALRYEPVE